MKLRRVHKEQWDVLACCTDSGACDLLSFFDDLEGKLAADGARMLALLEHLAEHGPLRNDSLSHQIKPGLWQLSKGDVRVLYFYDAGRVVVCSHGFVKRGQKTPAAEVARALAREQAYRAAIKEAGPGGVVVIDE